MKIFTHIPFFRILIPFLLGILSAIYTDLQKPELFYFILLLIPLTFLNFYRVSKPYYKWLFMLSADGFLVLFGIILVQLKDIRKEDNYYGKQILIDSSYNFIAQISDLPIEKEKYIKCDLLIKDLKINGKYKVVNGSVIAYFRKSRAGKNLKAGQKLLIQARFSMIQEPKNPYEFNYKKYLQDKQIVHTVFIDSSAYQILNQNDQSNFLWSLGLKCKAYVLSALKNSDLSHNAYAICAALLTGYDDDIEKPVMEAFAHSGTLHVLSVSGLHTGLIYLVLNFLFDLLDKKRKYKISRFMIITLLLWFFALITGFSPPVLRAVIMFNLLGAGTIFFRSQLNNQINILFVSAFLLLSYDPFFILDPGFLLSYFAMFGLLYYQPKLAANWQPQNKLFNYIWQSICASFAATISTLPITLFYFKQFPLWFFVCNIVVVPATFLLLILAVFVILKINGFALIINYLVNALIALILLFNKENTGFIDKIYFTFNDAFFLSITLILLSAGITLRSYKPLVFSLMIIICWQLFSLFESYRIKDQSVFTVYQLKNKSAFSLKNKRRVILTNSDSLSFNYSLKPHLTSFNYPLIENQSFNYIKFEDQQFLILKDPHVWPKTDLSKISVLILCNNFKLNEKQLRQFLLLKTIIVDGSNNRSTAQFTEKLSRKFGIDFYNTKQKGAYLLPIP